MTQITVNLPVEAVYNALGYLRDRLRTFALKQAVNGNHDDYEMIAAAIGRDQQNSYMNLSDLTSQSTQYLTSAWVYIAVSKIARAAAMVQMNVLRLKGEDKEPIVNHSIEILLRSPNLRLSGFNLMEQTVGFLQLNGNSYWYLSSDRGGPPDHVHVLRPDRIRIVPGVSEDRPVEAYIYELPTVKIPIDPDSIIHFKRWHPMSDFYGLSPLEAVAIDVIADQKMSLWNRNAFAKDKAVPAGLVTIANPVSDTEYERVKREWRDTYGGTAQATAFVRGDKITFQQMGLSHKELDFLASRQFTKEEIMLIYGIPPGMLDKNATEANALAGKEVFTSDTLYPQMVELADVLTLTLCPFYGSDLIVEPTDIRATDRKADLQERESKKDYITINEERDAEGLDPLQPVIVQVNDQAVNIGDLPASMGLTILGAGAKPPNPVAAEPVAPSESRDTSLSAMTKDAEFIAVTLEGSPDPLTSRGKSELSQFARFAMKGQSTKAIDNFRFTKAPLRFELAARMAVDIAHDEHDLTVMLEALTTSSKGIMSAKDRTNDPHAKLKVRYAKQISEATQNYFAELSTRVKNAIKHEVQAAKASLPTDLKKRVLSNLDAAFWHSESARLADQLQPIIQDLSEESMNGEADQIFVKYGVKLDPAKMIAYAATLATDWGNTYPDDITQTTQDGVNAIVTRFANSANGTLSDLTDAIDASYLFSDTRADVIGETETSRTTGNGQHKTAVQASEMMNVPMMFSQADFYAVYPAHINCRCHVSTIFIYDDQDKLIGVDMTWGTVHDLGAVKVCPICQPRDEMLLSEIANY